MEALPHHPIRPADQLRAENLGHGGGLRKRKSPPRMSGRARFTALTGGAGLVAVASLRHEQEASNVFAISSAAEVAGSPFAPLHESKAST